MTLDARDTGSSHDVAMERLVGNLLRIGVIIAAVVTAVGGLAYLVTAPGRLPDYHTFRGETDALRGVGAIVTGALALHTREIIQLGILLLIATPIARVLLSLVGFARERDWMYVAVTALVLALLLFSLLGGS
jgi:uncharacterized membrane protein